jgi:hypothetical protein
VTLLNEDFNPPLPSLASASLKKFKSSKELKIRSSEAMSSKVTSEKL